jgi:hypothetical protein
LLICVRKFYLALFPRSQFQFYFSLVFSFPCCVIRYSPAPQLVSLDGVIPRKTSHNLWKLICFVNMDSSFGCRNFQICPHSLPSLSICPSTPPLPLSIPSQKINNKNIQIVLRERSTKLTPTSRLCILIYTFLI